MHAQLTAELGPKVQRILRESPREESVFRAALILESGLSATVETLATRHGVDEDDIRALIVDFNVRGMKAITRQRPKQFNHKMAAEDRAIVKELIRLSPRAFGRSDYRWLAHEIIDFITTHKLVTGIDRKVVDELLVQSRNSARH